jgi:hypothetical protein
VSYQEIAITHPIARKAHRCIWCAEEIKKGSRHTHEVSRYDGEFQDHRWHDECLKASQSNGGEYEFDPYQNERGQP